MKKTNRTVIVQCRLSSTRLPGKALKKIKDKTLLAWALQSMHKLEADRYFLATDKDSYEELRPVCEENAFECFAGDLNDVLKRFCDLIRLLKADSKNPDCIKTIIRATADNPFLFYEAAQDSLLDFERINQNEKCDYLTYSGLPHGSGVEIFSGESLLLAENNTDSPYDHEHVGPALYNHTDKFDCRFIPAPEKYNYPNLRTTIDTYSDFLRAQVIANLINKPAPFTYKDILAAAKSKIVENPLILAPSVEKGHGTGHLRRCLSLAIACKAFLYIPKNADLAECQSLIEEALETGLESYQIISELPDESYAPVICTDAFKLTKEKLADFSSAKKIISIDEGSEYTDYCDYLLDIIPSAISREAVRKSNFFNPGFIQRPKNVRKSKAKEFKKILICIGGEDPRGFTNICAENFSSLFPDSKIFVITSKKVDETSPKKKNIEYLGSLPNLKEKLFEYDLVVTHYGLTAYEAAWASCGLILLPTSPLHKELARNYGFACVQDESISLDSIKEALKSPNIFPEKLAFSDESSLSDFIRQLSDGRKITCPICQKKSSQADKIVARNLFRTYRRCSNCSMIYLAFSTEPEKIYHKAYFFEEYKNQYGKTYKEDFDNIKGQCLRRTDEIKSLFKDFGEKCVLDIGCAYGPFLSAAKDKGFSVYGTDISDDAVDFVKNTLKFPACISAFPEIDTQKEFAKTDFDCVTMWYVIEHFPNLNSVLTKVSQLVKKDGIFAFSTPSGEGISVKSDSENFYKISPSDHFTLWEPSKADSILNRFGFKVEKIISTGHHPERFPEIKKSGAKKASDEWNKIDALSRKENLGDTVEIYCRKIK